VDAAFDFLVLLHASDFLIVIDDVNVIGKEKLDGRIQVMQLFDLRRGVGVAITPRGAAPRAASASSLRRPSRTQGRFQIGAPYISSFARLAQKLFKLALVRRHRSSPRREKNA
jgi:hypothetical protein